MDRLARAHYDAALRYKLVGNAQKAKAHFGRARHYAKLGQRFGSDAATEVTKLLFAKVPITSYSDLGEVVNEPWAPYFEQQVVDGWRRPQIRPTNAIQDVINVCNLRGQSILYCAYRFLYTEPHFGASLKRLLEVPGIDLGITNVVTVRNSYGEEETDMALSGLAADHPSMHFILEEVQKFGKLSDAAAAALHAPGCNVFSILQSRISGKKGYNPLALPERSGPLTASAGETAASPGGLYIREAAKAAKSAKAEKSPKAATAEDGVWGTGWFSTLFGLVDDIQGEFDQSWGKFTYDTQTGVLGLRDDPKKKWQAGKFEVVSLADLHKNTRNRTINLGWKGKQTTVRFVSGDVAIMHGDPEYAGACFQAASQFNCLEFESAALTPEQGVANWVFDPTQGPACAISCGAGTIVRHYFAHDDGTQPQRAARQINTLDDVIAALTARSGHGGDLVDVRNGYTNSDERRLAVLGRTLRDLDERERNGVKGLLKIGVQIGTQVTCSRKPNSDSRLWHIVDDGPLVTQVYASALAVNYACCRSDEWEPLARLVLEAAYEATIYAAIHHGPDKSPKVVLTALGGGVFGNKNEWIADAIVAALGKFSNAGLDVVINEYRDGALSYIKYAILKGDKTKDMLGTKGIK